MSWTNPDWHWRLDDGTNESLPYNTQLTTIIDGMDTIYTPKVCWIPFTLSGDTSGNHYLKYLGTDIVDTIDDSNIKFCFFKYGVENYGLPKSIPYNIDIPGACKGLTNLTTISLPSTIRSIDYYAFWGTSLSSVTLDYRVKYQNSSFPPNCTINIIDDRPFGCDLEYYIDTAVNYTIGSRDYIKYNDEPAIGMIIRLNYNGTPYTCALFMSPISPEAVRYNTEGQSFPALGSLIYQGQTWYYSNTDYAIDGYLTGTGMTNYPDIVNGPYTTEIITTVLESVHAESRNN